MRAERRLAALNNSRWLGRTLQSVVDTEDSGASGANDIVSRAHRDICDRLAMVGRDVLLRTDNGENIEALRRGVLARSSAIGRIACALYVGRDADQMDPTLDFLAPLRHGDRVIDFRGKKCKPEK